MPRTIAALCLLALAFHAGAAEPPDTKDYNLGVQAYRAKDYAAARQHWTRALAQGVAGARNNLGFLFYNGLGGEEDAVRAVALWRDAAALGNPESQWHLAAAYEEGKGTLRNRIEAYAWYRCTQVSYRLQFVADQDRPPDKSDAEIVRDIDASVARLQAALPEAKRKLAEELAQLYIRLYAEDDVQP